MPAKDPKKLLDTWAWWQGPFFAVFPWFLGWIFVEADPRNWDVVDCSMMLLSALGSALLTVLVASRLGRRGRGLVVGLPPVLSALASLAGMWMDSREAAHQWTFGCLRLTLASFVGVCIGGVIIWRRDLNLLRRAGVEAPGV